MFALTDTARLEDIFEFPHDGSIGNRPPRDHLVQIAVMRENCSDRLATLKVKHQRAETAQNRARSDGEATPYNEGGGNDRIPDIR